MASNVAKLLRYCFIRGNHPHFRSNRWKICCLLCNKNKKNKLKYNFSERASLLEVATVTGISTNWFENFQRFELWRVIFPGMFPTGVENWFEFAGVSNNRGFEKSGIKLQC